MLPPAVGEKHETGKTGKPFFENIETKFKIIMMFFRNDEINPEDHRDDFSNKFDQTRQKVRL